MSNGLNGKSLFIDFDSTFVKVETIDEIARITLQDNPDKIFPLVLEKKLRKPPFYFRPLEKEFKPSY